MESSTYDIFYTIPICLAVMRKVLWELFQQIFNGAIDLGFILLAGTDVESLGTGVTIDWPYNYVFKRKKTLRGRYYGT